MDESVAELPAQVLEREVENITPTLPARLHAVLPLSIPDAPMVVPVSVVVHAEHLREPLAADLSVTVQRARPE
jgi:hypothetical protein